MQVLAPTSLVLTDVRAILDTLDRTATLILMNASHHLADMVSETFLGFSKLRYIVTETFHFKYEGKTRKPTSETKMQSKNAKMCLTNKLSLFNPRGTNCTSAVFLDAKLRLRP